jgi:hypothetical protein
MSNSSTLVYSLMTSIDEIKDKITDGEYLNLCNILKSLNEEIKTKEEIRQETNNTDLNIREKIFEFLDNIQITDEEGNIIINHFEYLDLFNNFLKEIEEPFNNVDETINIPWFICPCGASVRACNISEHIEDEQHKNKLINDFFYLNL